MRHRRPAPARLALAAALLTLGACATAPPPAPPPPAPPPPGIADLMQRPAERALVEGIRAYDEGQYAAAEAHLRRSLASTLASSRDRASAHKLLAFITCTTERLADCATHFAAARGADPNFQLSRSEAGHPLWGPVYRRVVP